MNDGKEKFTVENGIALPDAFLSEFKKAMKIGYFKDFYKQGLITAAQLEKLILMQG